MKKFTIGYVDTTYAKPKFNKIWERGSAKKFNSIEECIEYIKGFYPRNREYKIMLGWEVIETFVW